MGELGGDEESEEVEGTSEEGEMREKDGRNVEADEG